MALRGDAGEATGEVQVDPGPPGELCVDLTVDLDERVVVVQLQDGERGPIVAGVPVGDESARIDRCAPVAGDRAGDVVAEPWRFFLVVRTASAPEGALAAALAIEPEGGTRPRGVGGGRPTTTRP